MLIGISGKKYSGKDTFFTIAADTLVKYSDTIVKRYAFADAVKDFAQRYFGVSSDMPKEKIRFILQGIGHMMREEVSKDFWVNKVLETYHKDLIEYGQNFCGFITDVRYKNEAVVPTMMVRVNRPTMASHDNHASEIDLDDYEFEHVIINDGTIQEYERVVRSWVIQNLL